MIRLCPHSLISAAATALLAAALHFTGHQIGLAVMATLLCLAGGCDARARWPLAVLACGLMITQISLMSPLLSERLREPVTWLLLLGCLWPVLPLPRTHRPH